LNDQRSLSMVLNSIGSVLHRLGRFDDALGAFQKGRAISEELNDQRGLAMILNSVGGTLQRLGRSAEALDSFQRSLSIGKALHDDRHLSMVYTNLGKFLASQKRLEEAALELGKGFEIDARLRNRRGLTIVTPTLIEVLLKLGRRDEARERCQQALSIAPREGKLLRLESSLAEASTVRKAVLKRGVVQRVLNHARGYRFAFIAPDDGGPDIYAREGFIDRATFAKLRQGITVEMDVESGPQGPRAVRLSVSEEATSQV
ncbi:MAG TPA: tetratricopeptide repeat protein, partial [Thermoanaerobaculia bacterium]|nr:tetratricopeptide repeat protein [Thermoanaerobaculia bacterium]